MGFPDKKDPKKWSVSELNDMLRTHVVCDRKGCSLQTFGCLEWESQLYRGIMYARCYPFKIRGHCFRNRHVDTVYHIYIPGIS